MVSSICFCDFFLNVKMNKKQIDSTNRVHDMYIIFLYEISQNSWIWSLPESNKIKYCIYQDIHI